MHVVIHYLEACLPDYFTGLDRPYLSIPVSAETDVEEIRDSLKHEFLCDRICGATEIPDGEEWDDKVEEAIDAITVTHKYPFSDIESKNEDEESVYAYFEIETID